MKFLPITEMFSQLSLAGLHYLPQSDPDVLNPLFISRALQPEVMFQAYQHGLFPWYNEDDPYILWWSPPQRCIIPTAEVHIARSLKKTMRQNNYVVTLDRAFQQVIEYCATVHGRTWIDERMKNACYALHDAKRMHSIELWAGEELIGGLYGLVLEHVFCAESMFSLRPSASKIALVKMCQYLQQRGIAILEAQFMTEHLRTMGAVEISRPTYFHYLQGKNPNQHHTIWHYQEE